MDLLVLMFLGLVLVYANAINNAINNARIALLI